MGRAIAPSAEWISAFAKAYLAHGRNGTAAYQEMYPQAVSNTARSKAAKLLKRADVQEALKEAINAMIKKFDTTHERLILEAARIAFLDPKALLEDDGSVKDIGEMDEDARRAIAGVDVDSRDGGDSLSVKIKISDKLRALEFIAKMQQMLIEKKQVDAKVAVSLADLLDDDLKPGTQEPETDMFA